MERSLIGFSIEHLVAQFSARTDQEWDWLPVYCSSGAFLVPLKPIFLAVADGYDEADINRALAEEGVGEIDYHWFSGIYAVKTEIRSGFELLLAANRLHLRPESRWAETNMMIIQSGPQGGEALCPLPAQRLNRAIPTVGGPGLALLALALAAAGLVVSRRRRQEANG